MKDLEKTVQSLEAAICGRWEFDDREDYDFISMRKVYCNNETGTIVYEVKLDSFLLYHDRSGRERKRCDRYVCFYAGNEQGYRKSKNARLTSGEFDISQIIEDNNKVIIPRDRKLLTSDNMDVRFKINKNEFIKYGGDDGKRFSGDGMEIFERPKKVNYFMDGMIIDLELVNKVFAHNYYVMVQETTKEKLVNFYVIPGREKDFDKFLQSSQPWGSYAKLYGGFFINDEMQLELGCPNYMFGLEKEYPQKCGELLKAEFENAGLTIKEIIVKD